MCRIETQRLLLRQLRDTDVGPLLAMLGSPTVMRWLFAGAPMGNHEGKSFIDKYFSFGELAYGLGTLCEKRTGCFVGFAGFLRCDYLDVDDFEFGFALHEESWAKGYAT